MAGVYALNRGMILRRVQRDRHEHVDSYGQIFKTITLVVTPFILSTAVYNLSSTVNNSIYTNGIRPFAIWIRYLFMKNMVFSPDSP